MQSLYIKLLAILLTLILSQAASAMALGELSTQTRLGDRLQAQIPIKLGNTDYSADDLHAHLMNSKEAAKYGVELLSARYQFQLSITEQGGQLVVNVKSRKPITEPFINLMLQLAWPGGSLAREYTVMLDY
jgi:Tfp pilus assembly protein FimV